MNLFLPAPILYIFFSCFYRTESGRRRNALGKGECFWTCLKRSSLFVLKQLDSARPHYL